jgi:hypothetical protein
MNETMVAQAIPVVAEQAAPCPPQVRAFGLLSVLLALSVAAAGATAFLRFPQGSEVGLMGASLAGMGASLLLLGGVALLARARWGRIPLWLFVWGAWPVGCAMTVAAAAQVADAGAAFELFLRAAGVSVGVAVFAFVLGRALLFGPVAAWTDGMPAARREGPSSASALALLSLIFAFVPPWGLMHAVSLLLGILAIGRIRRARGALHGRGLAIAGVCVSTGVFLLLTAGLGVAASYRAGRGVADEGRARQHLRDLAVLQGIYGELDLDGDGNENPCTTTLTALLDACRNHAATGPLDAAAMDALRAADRGVHGDRARPVAGYVFELQPPSFEVDGAPQWTIRAVPWRDGAAAHLELAPPTRRGGIPSEVLVFR